MRGLPQLQTAAELSASLEEAERARFVKECVEARLQSDPDTVAAAPAATSASNMPPGSLRRGRSGRSSTGECEALPEVVPCVFCIFAAFVWNGQSSRASGRKRTGFTVRFMLSVFGWCRGAARKGLMGIMSQFILQQRAISRPRRWMLMTVTLKCFPARG